jgi:hypothetical protein
VAVLFVGVNVTLTVPTPGITKGGLIYGVGANNIFGNSSPSKQTGIPITLKLVLDPISGMGGIKDGTTAGGEMVILSISDVLKM